MESEETKLIVYELAYLLRLGESEAIIEKALSDAGATITLKGPINQIQLAYAIAKQESALFGFFQMTLPSGEAVKQIEDALRHNEAVIRCLMVKLPKVKKPAPGKVREIKADAAAIKTTVKSPILPSISNIDSLSNEKLSETLEEILK